VGSLPSAYKCFNVNFQFELPMGIKVYASRPIDSSSNRRDLFGVVSRRALTVPVSCPVRFPPSTSTVAIIFSMLPNSLRLRFASARNSQ